MLRSLGVFIFFSYKNKLDIALPSQYYHRFTLWKTGHVIFILSNYYLLIKTDINCSSLRQF